MKLIKRFQTKLKAGEGERAVVAKITTTDTDRDGDVVLPSGLDLREFKRNPVVLFSHRSDELPVATAEQMEKHSNAIVAKVKFIERPASLPSEQEWVPDTLLSLFQQKVLRAFSIGFRVPSEGYRDATDSDRRKFGDSVRRVITKAKLFEFSVVTVPANQEALAIAVSKGLCTSSTAQSLGLTKPCLELAPLELAPVELFDSVN